MSSQVERRDELHRKSLNESKPKNPVLIVMYRKRELLLKQIQSQADQIKALMVQLDEANRKADNINSQISNAPSPATTTTDLYSSVSLSDTDTSVSQLSPPVDVAKPDVLDWIQKARESFEEFGGYISATTGLFGKDNDEYDDDENIAINIEDADEEDDNGTLMDEGDVDYDVSGDESSTAGGTRKHVRSSSNVAVSTTAAPFGMMAKLALETRRTSTGTSVVGDEEVNETRARSGSYFELSGCPSNFSNYWTEY